MSEKILAILINISFQFILIFAVTWLGVKIFRIRSASARYFIWLSVALCPLVLLLMNVAIPDLANFRVWNPDQNQQGLAGTRSDINLNTDTRADESALAGELGGLSDTTPSGKAGILAKAATLIISLWGVGVVISLVLVGMGYIKLNRLVLKAKVVDDDRIAGVFKQVREEIGISRRVQPLISDKAQSPFSIGFIHPGIILPENVLGPGEELEMILIHELIHLRRFDNLINFVCRFISSIMFFHPLYYVAARELEFATEQICDGWVVKLIEKRENYADCLLKLSQACIGRLPVGLSRRGNSMKRRIKSIFRSEEVFKMISRKNTILLSVLCLLNILFLSSVRVVSFPAVKHSSSGFNDSHRFSAEGTQPGILDYLSEEAENMAYSGEVGDLSPTSSNKDLINYYEKAEQALLVKKYQEAIDNYAKALEEAKKPEVNADALDPDFENLAEYKMAVCYTEIASQTQDQTMYDKALEIIPQVYESTSTAKIKEGALFLEGKIRYELKQYNEAKVKFRAVLDNYPESKYADEAQYFVAKSFFDEGNYDQAYREFENVKSEDNMTLAQARYFGSLSLNIMGRNQEALESYKKFVAEFPDSVYVAAAYYDMGTIQARMKNYEEANKSHTQAIQYTQDEFTRGMIQYQIGNNHFSGDNYQEAINAYKELIEHHTDNPYVAEASFMMAECYWFLKDYKNALDAYTKALNNDALGKNTARIMNRIGQCHSLLGNKEAALEWFQNVINKYPKEDISVEATYGKISAIKDLKRYEEAEKAGRDFIAAYKQNPKFARYAAEIQIILGDIKFDAKKYPLAVFEYFKVEQDYPDLPELASTKCRSLLKAGNAYYKASEEQNWDKGLLENAIFLYEKLIDDYGDLESLSEFIKTAKNDMDMARAKLR